MTPTAVLSWITQRMLGESGGVRPEPADWTAALETLSVNRLTTVAAWLLQDQTAHLPEEVRGTFSRAQARALFANERAGVQLGELGPALGDAKLEWVILRGLPLASRLYPDSICRPSRDVDLLVTLQAMDRADALLQALEYRRFPNRSETYHHRYRRTGAAGWDDIVELHWRADPPSQSGLPTGEILSTRQSVETAWGPLWVPGPQAELDLLVNHYVRHAGWQLILLLDILLLIGNRSPVSHRLGALLEDDQRRLGLEPRITGPRSLRQMPLRRWLSRHGFGDRRRARRAAPLEVALAQGHSWRALWAMLAGLLWPEQPSFRWQALSSTPWGSRSWRLYRLVTLGHGVPPANRTS